MINNIEDIVRIHNINFDKKIDEKYINGLNIKKIYWISNVAYLILLDSIDIYEVFEIAVDEKYKRCGYATSLISMLPKDKDIYLEVCEDNIKAIGLYNKTGFKKISIRKNYYGNKSAIIMKKENI